MTVNHRNFIRAFYPGYESNRSQFMYISSVNYLYAYLMRFFMIGPKIGRSGDLLVAVSNFWSHVLCLGFASRRVEVDAKKREVRIRYRRFWFVLTSKTVSFDEIHEVTYGYLHHGNWSEGDTDDMFHVGLRLFDRSEILLFNFYGSAEFENNTIFPDWFYWHDKLLADISVGPQEDISRLYAELISTMCHRPIGIGT